MSNPPGITFHQLGSGDSVILHGMLEMFGEAFHEPDTYGNARPGPTYLTKLLGSETFIALAAMDGAKVVGGIAAYELRKFEQERSEIYIYDLAVAATHRRLGVATAMIERLVEIATARGAWVVYVQADGDDEPAIGLYSRLGKLEKVLHFDIPVPPAPCTRTELGGAAQ
ncbi:MAG: AAC(3)-I family aminoglycoside N-acetyltransferase [Verrucomicrobiia bacterium]